MTNDMSTSALNMNQVVTERNNNKNDAYEKEQDPPKRRIRANVKETGFDSMKYYMKTMGNHELLKKNEEIILAREIQVLIGWEGKREELEAKLLRYVSHFVMGRSTKDYYVTLSELNTL